MENIEEGRRRRETTCTMEGNRLDFEKDPTYTSRIAQSDEKPRAGDSMRIHYCGLSLVCNSIT